MHDDTEDTAGAEANEATPETDNLATTMLEIDRLISDEFAISCGTLAAIEDNILLAAYFTKTLKQKNEIKISFPLCFYFMFFLIIFLNTLAFKHFWKLFVQEGVLFDRELYLNVNKLL
ncbi:hypothetical protein ACJX0J_033653 [Zea mays]